MQPQPQQTDPSINKYPEPFKQPLQQKNINIQIANRWRQENNYTGKGGVIVFSRGKIQGWVNELRDPQSWQPGCIAVDEAGNQWIAIDGNNYDGAESWEQVPKQTQHADPSIKGTNCSHPIKRKPIPVRSLADKLADPNTLTLPFTHAEINQLLERYAIYEHLNDVCFPDFGAFISHIVAEQLQGVSHA